MYVCFLIFSSTDSKTVNVRVYRYSGLSYFSPETDQIPGFGTHPYSRVNSQLENDLICLSQLTQVKLVKFITVLLCVQLLVQLSVKFVDVISILCDFC